MTAVGSARVALVVKCGRSTETVWAAGHATETHSVAWARLIAGSSAVAALL